MESFLKRCNGDHAWHHSMLLSNTDVMSFKDPCNTCHKQHCPGRMTFDDTKNKISGTVSMTVVIHSLETLN